MQRMRYLARHPEVPIEGRHGQVKLPESMRCRCIHLPFDHAPDPVTGEALRGPCRKCPSGACPRLRIDPRYTVDTDDPDYLAFQRRVRNELPPKLRLPTGLERRLEGPGGTEVVRAGKKSYALVRTGSSPASHDAEIAEKARQEAIRLGVIRE